MSVETVDRRRPAPRRVLRCAAPALLLATLALLPFLGSAFTIDDTLFLEQATHVLADPLHPTAFETVWSVDPFPMRMSQIMPSGAVAAWVLVPAALAGGSEVLAHLTQLGMLAAAILATVSIALRLGAKPRWAAVAGLLLASTPAALGMAGTAMPDVPAMALGVAGLERLLAWKQDRRVHQAVLAALLLGLAPLARTHLVLLLAVGTLLVAGDYLVALGWKHERWITWAPLVAGPVVTAAVVLVTRDPGRAAGDLAGSAQRFSDLRYTTGNVVAFATHWVLVLPLGIPWLALRARPVLRRWWIPVSAGIAAAAALAWAPWQGPRWGVPAVPIAALGVTVLADVFLDAWERRDSLQLTLALWLLVALPIAVYLHMPSKYLLASAPAAALLVGRLLERSSPALARGLAAAMVAAGIVLSIAILRANGEFAGLGRRAAAELIAPNVAAGHRVWFAGSWGFKWYATRAGGKIVTILPPFPSRGDLIVVTHASEPGLAVIGMLRQMFPRATLLRRIEDPAPGGRTMSHEVSAGFFSNAWGYLPWAWGDLPLDIYDLWRVD